MHHIDLEALAVEHLNALVAGNTEESLTLEFKRELDLDNEK